MILKIKLLVAKILVNDFSGKLISILFSNKIPFHNLRIDISNPVIRKRIAASLYFKTYESAEVRFISKYLKDYDGTIVELSASIGVVSSTLAKANPKATLYSFEADKRFIPIIENNFKINNITNANCFNEIIGASGYEFIPGEDNTMGKISKTTSESNQMTSLSLLIKKYNFSEFVLVSDIEGAEYFVLSEDNAVFNAIPLLIIELHPIIIENKLISVEALKARIEFLGYQILEQYGSNIVAKRK
ncbi:FkbM family methyltransferase [Flavobacterium sp. F372]|uniref:FkbM family methyltransferase n=1 Tax=Flavobacterium bernardetii TaxID=2813823 RepID=A0ABR7IUG4_9FLAO|nr:FkbM family methyltransferase [Flavobacterium bernardetii]MBC5833299.1 FkbM family methyltransferase [Flavobacterium bernardetii]NHF68531.1 FkbM family methyltransferase [Flavobacterium bernardetii]